MWQRSGKWAQLHTAFILITQNIFKALMALNWKFRNTVTLYSYYKLSANLSDSIFSFALKCVSLGLQSCGLYDRAWYFYGQTDAIIVFCFFFSSCSIFKFMMMSSFYLKRLIYIFVRIFQLPFGNTLNLVVWLEVDFQIEFHRARNLPCWIAEVYELPVQIHNNHKNGRNQLSNRFWL